MSKSSEYVYLKVPRPAWDTLSETLWADTEAGNFDPALREEIVDALEQIEFLPDQQ
jgi:hypothetical protein